MTPYVTILPRPPAGRWVTRAACRGHGPGRWYPTYADDGAYDAARRICAACPVRRPCLEWALDAGEANGMWGGRTPIERYHLGRSRRAAGQAGHADLVQLLYVVALVLFIAVMLRILGVRW